MQEGSPHAARTIFQWTIFLPYSTLYATHRSVLQNPCRWGSSKEEWPFEMLLVQPTGSLPSQCQPPTAFVWTCGIPMPSPSSLPNWAWRFWCGKSRSKDWFSCEGQDDGTHLPEPGVVSTLPVQVLAVHDRPTLQKCCREELDVITPLSVVLPTMTNTELVNCMMIANLPDKPSRNDWLYVWIFKGAVRAKAATTTKRNKKKLFLYLHVLCLSLYCLSNED